jgi:hypothetical protein
MHGNGQVYEPCGLTHGQSNEVHSNNFKIFFRDGKIYRNISKND